VLPPLVVVSLVLAVPVSVPAAVPRGSSAAALLAAAVAVPAVVLLLTAADLPLLSIQQPHKHRQAVIESTISYMRMQCVNTKLVGSMPLCTISVAVLSVLAKLSC
jgi:hypothetical protein